MSDTLGAMIQPKFQPVRLGKEDHLKRWTRFFETFPVGPNRSIEFWTEISEKFGWMDRAPCFRNFMSLTNHNHPKRGENRTGAWKGHD